LKQFALLLSTSLLAACAASTPDPLITPPDAAMVPGPVAEPVVVEAAATVPARNAELAAFFDAADKAELALTPLGKSYRGIIDADYGKWDDASDAAADASRELGRRLAAELRQKFDRARLSPEDQLSYDLFLYRDARRESIFPYRQYAYTFDQMNGAQSQGPAFLINIHRVGSVSDAEAYVSRLRAMARMLDQAMAESRASQALGVLPPKWVFPYVIADSKNVISGEPFTPGKESALWADFKG
jgi:uncharacterized protein (DUF885 family)